ncbi:UNVERIFIED_CONTAM: hypothetical protein K2H54_058364 [Gekko kuhli]
MQTAALMSVISALTFALAPAALSKEDEIKKKLKTDIPSYDNLDLDSDDISLDNYGEIIDLNNYEDIYDYEDLTSKVLNSKGFVYFTTNKLDVSSTNGKSGLDSSGKETIMQQG